MSTVSEVLEIDSVAAGRKRPPSAHLERRTQIPIAFLDRPCHALRSPSSSFDHRRGSRACLNRLTQSSLDLFGNWMAQIEDHRRNLEQKRQSETQHTNIAHIAHRMA